MRRWLLLFMVSLGCAGLPHATAEDVSRAKTLYPDATSASLEEGRAAFVADCSGCHNLPLPSEHAPEEWPEVVKLMAGRGHLSVHDRVLIEQYLVTVSDRSTSPQAPR